MSDVAIRVDNLGKRYRIGARVRYRTLRDLLAAGIRIPERWVREATGGFRVARTPRQMIWALRHVSFQVSPGEVVGIIGRNGAGKSTLLKVLSRITRPTEGRAELRGRLGSLLEVGTGFHPELTGRENIYLNGAILGMRRSEITSRFDEIVDFAGTKSFLDTPVKHYSSGMYMRLAFAVAAHLETEILLVDEVLAVGDVAFQRKCLGKMDEVAKAGRTVLFVSHNMSTVFQLCSRTIWIDSGTISADGETQDVVGSYLRDSGVPLGIVNLDPSDSRVGARLLRAWIADVAGEPQVQVTQRESFDVTIEYAVSSAVEGLSVGFRMRNDGNLPVLVTSTADAPEVATLVGRSGTHRVSVRIPGWLLAPGRYYLELGLWSPASGHHDHADSALAFDVTSEALDRVSDEVLRPRLAWTLDDQRTVLGGGRVASSSRPEV